MLRNFCYRIIKVGEEGGEREEVEDDDAFPFGILWYFFV